MQTETGLPSPALRRLCVGVLTSVVVFRGPGSLAPFTLLSLDVSVKPLIVFVTALWVPNTLFNYLDSVLVYQISSFLESVVV